ncbi:NADPH-dependent fmn reductase [Desulfosarcina ovata subsp. sediminis]|uniref:NADPH-dependent fmn reductase n=1 Tax=Desulfosarcina ovata subsp. sediminis TaxID=885957 RepID=A0A5K7ZN75_9BACT|nr:flavodoxin family protein [Desulfosarcina ovata]BBO82611.1 NADPH-dependent fmn reductase [Desulfosarcina ovata subsp. sediminis]
MAEIAAVYGSPRRKGNTTNLLKHAVEGARDAGADVTEIVLRDLKISPCLEIYGCKQTGRCVIKDDFRQIEPLLDRMDGMMLASPIFFYAVSAHTKAFMDRCNAFWVKKYWIDKKPFGKKTYPRKGLFVSVGSTGGKRLFDGAILSVRYFMDALDMELWQSLVFRHIESEGDILEHPDMLKDAYDAGMALARELSNGGGLQPPAVELTKKES